MTFARIMNGVGNSFIRAGDTLTNGAKYGLVGGGLLVGTSVGVGFSSPDALIGGLFVAGGIGSLSAGAGAVGLGCKLIGRTLPKIATKMSKVATPLINKQ